MYSKIYNYSDVGTIYQYKARHSTRIVDLIDEVEVDSIEINISFSLKLEGKSSSGKSIFKFEIHNLTLPEVLNESINDTVLNFITEYHKIAWVLNLRLSEDGTIERIGNVDELKEKWVSLRSLINEEPQNEVLDDLLKSGDEEYGDLFHYNNKMKTSLIFKTLFPSFYNAVRESVSLIGAVETQSSFFPELTLPVISYFNYIETSDSVIIEEDFDQNDIAHVRQHYTELDLEEDFKNYFYKKTSEYQLDKYDHISFAELIQIETLNGAHEAIDHIEISRLS